MQLQITYEDMATPYLKQLVANNPKWIASALKSAAWKSQKVIKSGIQSGAPGGQAYAPMMPDKMRRALDIALGNTGKTRYSPMGRLQRAVGYDSSRANQGSVTVGWLSHSAVYLGSKQQEGFSTEVTDKLRRAFAAAGIKLSADKNQLHTASRPTFPPVLPDVSAVAAQAMQDKLLSYIMGNTQRSAVSSGRTYKVYR